MSDKSDKIVIRLISIITRLNNGEEFTVKELAEEFDVSQKTIQTDLNKRLNQYLPITRKNAKYSLESYLLGRLKFDDIKNFAILSGIAKLYPGLDESFLADVLNEKIRDACDVRDANYEDISDKREEFDLIRLAITLRHQLHFTYNNKQRVVNPYKLLNNHNNIWYLVADENGTLKTFTFTKIENLEKSEVEFFTNNDFKVLMNSKQYNWISKEPINIVLQINPEVKEYFLRRELLPKQTILCDTTQQFIVKTTIAYKEELFRIVRYWIPHIKIIEPEYMHEELLSQLNNYITS